MGYGIGRAPTQTGTVPTPEKMPVYDGTSPEDVQRWVWSLYRTDNGPALVRGGSQGSPEGVVSGTSSMEYQVAAGVAVFPAGYCQSIAVPFERGRVATLPAPTSGTRTDYVYLTADGAVQVGRTQPNGTALLDKRTVPANITATTATTSVLGDMVYSPLYGASSGKILGHTVEGADNQEIDAADRLMLSRTFTLDSDRVVQINLLTTYRTDATFADNANYASIKWGIYIDGAHNRTFQFHVNRVPETKNAIYTVTLPAGTHNIQVRRSIERYPINGVKVLYRYGGESKWPGTRLELYDMGMAV